MTYRVLVCGAEDYANAEMVRYALSRLRYQRGEIEVNDVGGPGASAGARWYRSLRGWPGQSAWAMTAIDDLRIDYVLCFGDDARGVVSKARSLGITVGEVP